MSVARELCKEELVSISRGGVLADVSDRLRHAQVYALLDIADAIREHTEALRPERHSIHLHTTHPAGKDHS